MPGNPYPGKYKYGKQTKTIDFDTFEEMMEDGEFKKGDLHRSFLVFLYWFGVRRDEALRRKPKDFEVDRGVLFVEVPPLKHGQPRPPLEIDVDMPYVDLILEQVAETEKGERVWPFSEITAWRIVNRIDEHIYPHFFRLNRCTRMLDDPQTTIPEVKTWFGWKTTKTIDEYVGYSRRHMRRGRARLRQEIKI